MTHEEKLAATLAILDDPRLQPVADAVTIARHWRDLDAHRRSRELSSAVGDVFACAVDVFAGIRPGTSDERMMGRLAPLRRAVAHALPMIEEAIGRQFVDRMRAAMV